MTSKSTKKDYKALYNSLKNEHNFVLKQSSNALSDALNRLKAKDEELAAYKKIEADFQITSLIDIVDGYHTAVGEMNACYKELAKYKIQVDETDKLTAEHGWTLKQAVEYMGNKADAEELTKYKEAEKAYKAKFGLEETRLTSQEMKEMERRAREEEDEDDDRPLVPKKKSKPKK